MQTRKKLLLRIENSLWEEVSRWAADDFRSINAQIEFLLREAIKRKKKLKETEFKLNENLKEMSNLNHISKKETYTKDYDLI
mgnify:CR=1 FL=1